MPNHIYEPSTTGEPIDTRAYNARHYREWGRFMGHLDVLEEWNEVVWLPTDVLIHTTDLGTIVTCNCAITEIPDGKSQPYHHGYTTVVAMYADDDFLFRIVCFDNDHTSIVFESSRPMRA